MQSKIKSFLKHVCYVLVFFCFCMFVLTLGAVGCVGVKTWRHHNSAAYHWRGAAGMWAVEEMPTLQLLCSPDCIKIERVNQNVWSTETRYTQTTDKSILVWFSTKYSIFPSSIQNHPKHNKRNVIIFSYFWL